MQKERTQVTKCLLYKIPKFQLCCLTNKLKAKRLQLSKRSILQSTSLHVKWILISMHSQLPFPDLLARCGLENHPFISHHSLQTPTSSKRQNKLQIPTPLISFSLLSSCFKNISRYVLVQSLQHSDWENFCFS